MSDTKTKAYLATTTLFHQQDLHPWIYHIQTGFVIVYGISPNGKQGLTDLYGPDSWFGPGLNDGIAGQNAVAKAGCVMERIKQQALPTYLASRPALTLQLIQQVSQREHQLQQRLFLQQTASLAVRLAWLLSHLFAYQGQHCGHGHKRDLSLTQQEIASMVGGSRQSVSQLLASWRQHNIIDYTRSFICLIDAGQLQQLRQEPNEARVN